VSTGPPAQDDRADPPRRRRPALVWIIVVYTVLLSATVLFGLGLLVSGSPLLSDEDRAAAGDIASFQGVTDLLALALNLSAAVALFALRRVAVPLYAAGLGVSVVSRIAQLASPIESGGSRPVVPVMIGLAILVAFLLYARRLARTGVLR
jgi:hypothetical protein